MRPFGRYEETVYKFFVPVTERVGAADGGESCGHALDTALRILSDFAFHVRCEQLAT